MLADFPIEQCCSHRGARAQLEFAQKAMELLPKQSSTAFQPEARGLVIRAETELELERPVRRLAEVYGDMMRFAPPAVRYRHGDGIEQPIMGLRVLFVPDFYEAIKDDLRLRRAAILDSEVNRRFGILRANAPLASLLGYPGWLANLTSGRAHLVMWLSHYEQFDDPPPGVAA